MLSNKHIIAVVGLGYVGMPLAIEFGKRFPTIGYDLAQTKVDAYNRKFKPGLVGGHCIGVDPYYLTHKAEMLGYHPQVIIAGRRINDGMGKFIAENTVKLMIQQGINIKGAKISVLGLTFKEDCTDLRNSKVIDMIRELQDFGCEVTVHDPLADPQEAMHEYGVVLTDWNRLPERADALVVAVSHQHYLAMPFRDITDRLMPKAVFVDVKSAFDPVLVIEAGFNLWRL